MSPLDPLGPPGGLNRGQTPQNGKIEFLATFLEEIFLSFLGSLGTLILSPTIQKNWGLTLFWYIFGPKTAKKEQTFMRHSSFGSGWIFYFISKINYFRPFLWPVFFSNWKIAIQRWAKLKTLGCDTPLFYLLKKKICKSWVWTHAPICNKLLSSALPTEPPRLFDMKSKFWKNQ